MNTNFDATILGVIEDSNGRPVLAPGQAFAIMVVPDWATSKDQKLAAKIFAKDLRANILVMTETIHRAYQAEIIRLDEEPEAEEASNADLLANVTHGEEITPEMLFRIASYVLEGVKRQHNTIRANLDSKKRGQVSLGSDLTALRFTRLRAWTTEMNRHRVSGWLTFERNH